MSQDINTILGNKIRLYREKRGLTQIAAGEAAGYSKNTISNLENGITAVSVEHVFRLSDVFEVPVSEFIKDIPGFTYKQNELQPYIVKLALLNPAYRSLVYSNIDQLLVIQQSDKLSLYSATRDNSL